MIKRGNIKEEYIYFIIVQQNIMLLEIYEFKLEIKIYILLELISNFLNSNANLNLL